jgi:hypothetical protein
MGPQILKRLYSCTIENILTGCITAWYGNSTALDHMALPRVVQTAQYITGAELPAIQNLYIRRCEKILFSRLPHSKRYRCTKSDTDRLLNSFYPKQYD